MRNSCTVPAFSLWAAIFLLLIPEDFCEKVIGGHDVKPYSRPYMVLFKTENKLCAGALIKEDWVLTAAHCALNNRSQVILGTDTKTKDELTEQKIFCKKHIPYPHYERETHENDLQLVQLNKKSSINKKVTAYGVGNVVTPNTICRVTEWGKVNNKTPKILKEVKVKIMDRKTCNDKYQYNYETEIGQNMICARNLKGGKDPCDGDSGSPLICKGELRGIFSFHHGKCGDRRFPGIYTLLSQKHINWIKRTMKRPI